jgi:hypothetical protein
MTSAEIKTVFAKAMEVVAAAQTLGDYQVVASLAISPMWEIAYQLAVYNEREAESAPTQIVQRIREFEGRISALEALDTGRPIYSMPSSANAEPTAQQPTPEAK